MRERGRAQVVEAELLRDLGRVLVELRARTGCLNNFAKTNERVCALWARVLESVPGSELILLAPEGSARQRVSAFFERAGIVPERIQFRSPEAARRVPSNLPEYRYRSRYGAPTRVT